MSELSTSPTAARPGADAARWALPLLGVAAGVLTSFLQGWLPRPWDSLANSASPWLAVAFLVGYLLRRGLPAAAVLGALTCFGELAGYCVASTARGFGYSTAFVAVWALCGLVGGPLFGACGHLVRAHAARPAAVGPAAPAATFLGEGIGGYWIRLGYHQDALLFLALGLVAGALALVFSRARALTLAVLVGGTLGGVLVYGFVLRALG